MIMTIRTIEPMTRRQPFIMAMVTGAVAAVAAPVYGGPGVRTTLQFDEAVRVESALLADVDGDGARDLVLATGTRGDDFARHLQIFRRRPGAVCFPAQPDLTYELVPSVIAFGAGDVTAAPGEEIVLFTVRGAYAWETGAGVETLPRPLLKGEFLWQLPHQRKVFSWQAGLQDLDGDGLTDIVFPEPEGYRIGLQRRQDGESSFLDSQWPRLPPEHFHQAPNSLGAQRVQAEARVREISIGLNLGQESGEPAQTELSVVEVVPAPNFKDFGGDGRPDLLALSGENLFVWTQGQGGFGRDPDVRQEFPIEMDAGRRIDLSFAAHADDLDGNGRTDCVILAGDRKSEDLRTQILVYLNGVGQDKTPEASLFGSTGVPQQVLLVGGIVGAVDLTDVDGDGARDLVLGAVKVDTIDAIRAVSSGTIEASLRVYLNHRGTLLARAGPHVIAGDRCGRDRGGRRTALGAVHSGSERRRDSGAAGPRQARSNSRPPRAAIGRKARGPSGSDRRDSHQPAFQRPRARGPGGRGAGDSRARAEPGAAREVRRMSSIGRCVIVGLAAAAVPSFALSAAEPRQIAPVQTIEVRPSVSAFRVVDVDADGADDLVLVRPGGQVDVARGGGDGRWTMPVGNETALLREPARTLLAFGDLLGRGGAPQLIVLSPQGLTAHALRPDGGFEEDGTMLIRSRRSRPLFDLRVGQPRFSGILSDVNGDGRLDVVVPAPVS